MSDCFDNALSSKSKKLPPKAEKLLLFRFLDKFNRKITAALTAYLLLGLFATKYIGEIQLQKFIDEAQVARFVDWPHAQWKPKTLLNRRQQSESRLVYWPIFIGSWLILIVFSRLTQC